MIKHHYIIASILVFTSACQLNESEKHAPIDTHELTIAQSENGWSVKQFIFEKTVTFEMNNTQDFSPRTKSSCPQNPATTIKLPVEKTTLVLFYATTEIRDICIPTLNIQSSAIPGLIQSIDISHTDTGLICGTCEMKNGELNTRTTLVFEFVEP